MKAIRDIMVERLDAILTLSGMSEKKFGREIAGQPELCERIRHGHVTLATWEKVETFAREILK